MSNQEEHPRRRDKTVEVKRKNIAIAFVVVTVIFVFGLRYTMNASHKAQKAADQAQAAADSASREAKIRSAAIQASRLQVCRKQNERHNNTIKVLNGIFKKFENANTNASPEQKAAVQRSHDANVLLINALVPLQDCKKILRPRLNPGQKKKINSTTTTTEGK